VPTGAGMTGVSCRLGLCLGPRTSCGCAYAAAGFAIPPQCSRLSFFDTLRRQFDKFMQMVYNNHLGGWQSALTKRGAHTELSSCVSVVVPASWKYRVVGSVLNVVCVPMILA
jgi:hypothetical protein